MHKEITYVKSVKEIEAILLEKDLEYYFIDKEIKSVEHKNSVKSLGARYLIKKSILDFLNLNDGYKDIAIESNEQGKPNVEIIRKVKEKIDERGIKNVQISISHSRNFISTLVVLEKDV